MFYATIYHKANNFRMRVCHSGPEQNETILDQLKSEGYTLEELEELVTSQIPASKDTLRYAIKG